MTRTDKGTDRLKVSALVIWGAAVVAMGAIEVATGGHGDSQIAVVSDGSMSTGETTTSTFSGTVAPVINVPVVKANPHGAT